LKKQPGAVRLAAKSGSPIMPIVWAAKRYKVFNSWDHSVIPMPFSPIVLQYGDLIYVESRLTSQRIEEYRHQVETVMMLMYQQLWQNVGKQGHVEDLAGMT
jgi:lysophospholipid acyltransferase (LPLAT)-like uncharacterized protein